MGLSRRKRIARFHLATGISLEGESIHRWRVPLTGEYTVVTAKQSQPTEPGKPDTWSDLVGVQRIPRASVAYYTLLHA